MTGILISEPLKLDYLGWNDVLARHFFDATKGGTGVYLYANEEIIAGLGRPHSADITDLVRAATAGPPWVESETGFCQKAHQTMVDWRDRGSFVYPPHLAYLVIFSAAAAIKTGF